MVTLSAYIKESIDAHRAKPIGYIDDSEFKGEKYLEYWLCLMQAIAKCTPLKRNESSNGIWEELSLDDKFVLKAIKMSSVGKNSNASKPKKIGERVVETNYENVINALFGKGVDKKLYEDFDALASFIASSDYKHRSKERMEAIINEFESICVKKNLTKKLYKIKPWLKSKVETIL